MIEGDPDLLIERDHEHQVETIKATGAYTKFRIVWLNPCTYRLFFLEGTEDLYQAWQNSFLEVIIVEGTHEEYTYKATFSGTGRSEMGKVRKINSI